MRELCTIAFFTTVPVVVPAALGITLLELVVPSANVR